MIKNTSFTHSKRIKTIICEREILSNTFLGNFIVIIDCIKPKFNQLINVFNDEQKMLNVSIISREILI